MATMFTDDMGSSCQGRATVWNQAQEHKGQSDML